MEVNYFVCVGLFFTLLAGLEKQLPESYVLDLPEEFTTYLLADGIVLPKGCNETLNRQGLEADSDDETSWEEDEAPEAEIPSFPDLDTCIKSNIEELGGSIFPKLNWSSPKDARWITFGNTLKCTSPKDVYLLLKSSNFITHDLTRPFTGCLAVTGQNTPLTYQLVLRKWRSINPGMEFRCFVKNNYLLGICQRHHTCFYPFLEREKESIEDSICNFYDTNIQGKFPDDSYVFDVYLRDDKTVVLIDFNPFGPVTDSLLFDWEDLEARAAVEECTEFRYVKTNRGVQPNPFEIYGIPEDFVHLSTGEDPHKLIDFLKLKRREQNDDSSSDEEN